MDDMFAAMGMGPAKESTSEDEEGGDEEAEEAGASDSEGCGERGPPTLGQPEFECTWWEGVSDWWDEWERITDERRLAQRTRIAEGSPTIIGTNGGKEVLEAAEAAREAAALKAEADAAMTLDERLAAAKEAKEAKAAAKKAGGVRRRSVDETANDALELLKVLEEAES